LAKRRTETGPDECFAEPRFSPILEGFMGKPCPIRIGCAPTAEAEAAAPSVPRQNVAAITWDIVIAYIVPTLDFRALFILQTAVYLGHKVFLSPLSGTELRRTK
jgi:hypothetical protein